MFERMFVKIPKSRILQRLRFFFWPAWQAWLKTIRRIERFLVVFFYPLPVPGGFVRSPSHHEPSAADWAAKQKVVHKKLRFARGVFSPDAADSSTADVSENFVVVIPDGRVWGNMGAVVTSDNRLLGDVSREGDFKGDDHPIFRRRTLPAPRPFDGSAAVLSLCNGGWYFHWLCQSLPRLFLLSVAGLDTGKIDHFVVNGPLKPFQKETLSLLGIPEGKIVESSFESHVTVRSLAVTSLPGNRKRDFDWIVPFLRGAFLAPVAVRPETSGRRLYISRADAEHRRVMNEEDVVRFLGRYGFENIQLGSISFREQVALFAEAAVVIGPHGAGLSNLAFCAPGTEVIEFLSPTYRYDLYESIACSAGLNYQALAGPGDGKTYPLDHRTFCDDIRVDMDRLTELLKTMQII